MIAPATQTGKTGFRLLILLPVILSLLTLTAPALPARAGVGAQADRSVDLPLNLVAPGDDLVLRGNSVQQTLDFPLLPNWKIEAGSELRLLLRYSPLLKPDRSTLTVSLGGTPLGAARLDPAGAGGTTIAIKLPALQPAGGILSLTLDAALRTNDLPCGDSADPAAYLTLGHESSLHIEYTPQAQDLRLKDAPALLVAGRFIPGSRLVFVMPVTPTLSDWQAASMIAGRLGQLAGSTALQISVLAATDKPGAALGDANVVFVGGAGLRERLAGVGLPIAPAPDGAAGAFQLDDEVVGDDQGLLELASLPWTPDGLALIVAGGKDDALVSAASVLLDDSRLALLQNDTARVPATSQLPPKPADAPLAEAPSTTLEQLGLQDQTVYGVGTHTITETVFVPPFWQIAGDAELALNYSNSDLLLPDRSEIAVLFNGVPAGSVALAQGGQQRTYAVKLPQKGWRAGDNVIEYRFELHVADEQQNCAPDDARNVWATVFNSTKLALQYAVDRTRRVDLALYPYPYSGTGPDQGSARIILPYNPTTDEQSAALGIVAGLSRFVAQGETVPLLVPAELAEASKYTFDLILLGGPERNPISTQINDRLPVQWNGNTAQTLRTQWGVVFPAEGQGDVGLVQEITSPWNANRLILDAGYTRPGLAVRVADAIGAGLHIGKFSGNVLVVDLQGKTTAINTVAPAAPTVGPTPVLPATTGPTPRRPADATWPLVLLLAVILLLGLVLLALRFMPRQARQA